MRIIDCCDGKVSYDSLSTCEKIAFNLYGSNDAKRNAVKILELLLSQAQADEYLIHLPIDNEFLPLTISREINILVESKILNPARIIGNTKDLFRKRLQENGVDITDYAYENYFLTEKE